MNSPIYYFANFMNLEDLDSHELYGALVSNGYYPDNIIASLLVCSQEDGSVIYRAVFADDDGQQSDHAFIKAWYNEDKQLLASYAS